MDIILFVSCLSTTLKNNHHLFIKTSWIPIPSSLPVHSLRSLRLCSQVCWSAFVPRSPQDRRSSWVPGKVIKHNLFSRSDRWLDPHCHWLWEVLMPLNASPSVWGWVRVGHEVTEETMSVTRFSLPWPLQVKRGWEIAGNSGGHCWQGNVHPICLFKS